MWYAASVIVRSPLDSLIHSVFITGVAIALFTPTIVHDLGYSANNAQLLSIPPFFLAGVSTYIASMWSDRLNLRGPFIAAGSLFSMIGYIIAYTTNSPGAGYAAAIIAACGSFPCIAISVAWAGGNAGGNMKRGIVLALVVGLGSVGGCVFLLGCRERRGSS
jgi:MFS family permease